MVNINIAFMIIVVICGFLLESHHCVKMLWRLCLAAYLDSKPHLGYEYIYACFLVIFADQLAQSLYNDSQTFIIFVTAEMFLCLVNTLFCLIEYL